jgi:hypothetical protein
MELENKIDEVILALMTQNKFEDGNTTRAWKCFDESLARLQEKNYIRGSHSLAKSVLLTPEGLAHAEKCFKKHILENG